MLPNNDMDATRLRSLTIDDDRTPPPATPKPVGGLGSLGTLPTELRTAVFEEALGPARRPSPLPLLLVSHTIHREAEPLLYARRGVIFHLEPPREPSPHCTSFQVSDSYGTDLGHFTPQFLGREQIEPRSQPGPLRRYPFGRLGYVGVAMEAPDPDDSGQLVALWNHVVWIADLLAGCRPLPPLGLLFHDGREFQWHWGDILNASLGPAAGPVAVLAVSDLEILLQPFRRLQSRVAALKIHIERLNSRSHASVAGTAAAVATSGKEKAQAVDLSALPVVAEMTAAARPDAPRAADRDAAALDRVLCQRVDGMSAWLEYCLDDMEGPAAAALRFEQLGSWSLEHAAAARRRVADGLACGVLEPCLGDKLYRGICERRHAAWAFRPLDAAPTIPQPWKEQSLPPVDFWKFGQGAMVWQGNGSLVSAWRSYWVQQRVERPPIPRKSSEEYLLGMMTAERNGEGSESCVSMEHEEIPAW